MQELPRKAHRGSNSDPWRHRVRIGALGRHSRVRHLCRRNARLPSSRQWLRAGVRTLLRDCTTRRGSASTRKRMPYKRERRCFSRRARARPQGGAGRRGLQLIERRPARVAQCTSTCATLRRPTPAPGGGERSPQNPPRRRMPRRFAWAHSRFAETASFQGQLHLPGDHHLLRPRAVRGVVNAELDVREATRQDLLDIDAHRLHVVRVVVGKAYRNRER